MGLDSEYPDTGCSVHPTTCLTCPLPKCVYDLPDAQRQSIQQHAKNWGMAQDTVDSNSQELQEIADREGVTVRTVWRVKARYVGAGGDYVKFLGF